MKSYPSSGYVVPLEKMIAFASAAADLGVLPRSAPSEVLEALRAVQEDDNKDLFDELDPECWVTLGLPVPEELFKPCPDNGDDLGDLDEEWYLIYSESVLFEQVKTKELEHMEATLGLTVEHANWSTFG